MGACGGGAGDKLSLRISNHPSTVPRPLAPAAHPLILSIPIPLHNPDMTVRMTVSHIQISTGNKNPTIAVPYRCARLDIFLRGNR